MSTGQSTNWRFHQIGGWKALCQQIHREPWHTSEVVWHAAQSLCLLRIMGGTIRFNTSSDVTIDEISAQDSVLDSLVENSLFGHTLGASGPLLRIIHDINKLVERQRLSTLPDHIEEKESADILSRLERCHDIARLKLVLVIGTPPNVSEPGVLTKRWHLYAFTSSTFIYYYQSLRSAVPQALTSYVSEVLKGIRVFTALGGRNFTLWPLFIAATEVYLPEDIICVTGLLRDLMKTGQRNRGRALTLLEEIWRMRQIISNETKLPLSRISIDWRQIMHKLDIDILLV